MRPVRITYYLRIDALMDRTSWKPHHVALEGTLPYQVLLQLHNYNKHMASQGKEMILPLQ